MANERNCIPINRVFWDLLEHIVSEIKCWTRWKYFTVKSVSFCLYHTALLGRGPRAPETDPHELVYHVHVRQHHLHLPHYDGLHDGLEANTGTNVHVCQWVSSTTVDISFVFCLCCSASWEKPIKGSYQGVLRIIAYWSLNYSLFCCVSAFKLLESSSQQWLQGLVYLIGNLLGSALAIYKCQSMGLLPTHSSDWLAFIEPPQVSAQVLGCFVISRMLHW